jgi:flavodoxin
MSKVLVAYFSNSGHTAKIADILIKETKADSYRIEPKIPYSGFYEYTLARAQKELANNEFPEIINCPENLSEYDTILLGAPNWSGTLVPPILSFLTKYDFTGKTIFPFCTYAKGSYGRLVGDLQNFVPNADVETPFQILDVNINDCEEQVYNWLHIIKNYR